jgi:hypothetical protein
MVHRHENGFFVLSRLHWHVATIWTEPVLRNDKPSVHFTRAIHTPIVESSSYDWRYVELEPTIPHTERISVVTFYLPLFDKILKGKRFAFRRKFDYSDRVVNGGVPSKYIFRLEDLKEAVVIGRMFRQSEVPQILRDKLWRTGSGF